MKGDDRDQQLTAEMAEAMRDVAESNRRAADAQESHARQAHTIDYRHRSLDIAVASFQPGAGDVPDERILKRAEAFWEYLMLSG